MFSGALPECLLDQVLSINYVKTTIIIIIIYAHRALVQEGEICFNFLPFSQAQAALRVVQKQKSTFSVS